MAPKLDPGYSRMLSTPASSVNSRHIAKFTDLTGYPTDHTTTRSTPLRERFIGSDTSGTHMSPSLVYTQSSCLRFFFTLLSLVYGAVIRVSPLERSTSSKSVGIGTKWPSVPLGSGACGLGVPSKRGPCSILVRKVVPST